MKTYTFYVQTDNVGSKVTGEFEMPDDATPEEIEEAAKDAAFNHMEWGYEEKESE